MLSRNKVAVPEGAAGTPPFWSPKIGVKDHYCFRVLVWFLLFSFVCLLYHKKFDNTFSWYVFKYMSRERQEAERSLSVLLKEQSVE